MPSKVLSETLVSWTRSICAKPLETPNLRRVKLQRAENGALDPWSLDVRLGCPQIFAPNRSETLQNKGLGASGLKIRAPQKRRFNDHGSNAPFSALSKMTPDPDSFEKHRDTYFCNSMASAWQKVVCTPPTIRLPFVSRCFCRSIRVRGRWDTPKNCPQKHPNPGFSWKTRHRAQTQELPLNSCSQAH